MSDRFDAAKSANADTEFSSIVKKVFDHHLNLATESELYEQVTAAKLCFVEADRDGSGALSFDEIGKLCLLMGLKQDKDEESYMSTMDSNESGCLDLVEWLEWWLNKVSRSPNPAKQQEVIARHTFKKFDKDNSGYLDASELSLVIEQLGASLTGAEMEQAVTELDTDGSHRIEIQEFVDWWAGRSLKVRGSQSLIGMKLKSLAKKSMQLFSTDIFEAVWRNDYDLVKAFLDGDRRLAMSSDTSDKGESWMPLHYAAYQGFERIVQLLVNNLDKSQINLVNAPGFTPLFYACQRGHVEVARILLDKGADPSIWTRVHLGDDQADIVMSPLDYINDYPDLKQLFFNNQNCAKPPESVNTSLLDPKINLFAKDKKGCIRFNFGKIFTDKVTGKTKIPRELGFVGISTWHFVIHTTPAAPVEEAEDSHNKRNNCSVVGPVCSDGNAICCSVSKPVDVNISKLIDSKNSSFAIAFWFLQPQFSESGVVMSINSAPVVNVKSSQIAIYSAWSYFCLRLEKNGHMVLEIADGVANSFKTSSGFPFAGLIIKSEKPILPSKWSYVYIVVDTDKKEVSLIVDQIPVGKAPFSGDMSDVTKLNSFKSAGIRVGMSSIPDDEKGIYSIKMRPSSALVSDVMVYDKQYYPTPTSRVFKHSVKAKPLIDENQTHLVKIASEWLTTLFANSLPNQDIIVTKPVYLSVSAENKVGLVGPTSEKMILNCQDYINTLNSTLENMTMALLNDSKNDEDGGGEYEQDEFETLKEEFLGLKNRVENTLESDIDVIEGAEHLSQGSHHSRASKTGGGAVLNSSTDDDILIISSKPKLAENFKDVVKQNNYQDVARQITLGAVPTEELLRLAKSSKWWQSVKALEEGLNAIKLSSAGLRSASASSSRSSLSVAPIKDYKAVAIETPQVLKVYPTPSPTAPSTSSAKISPRVHKAVSSSKRDPSGLPNLTAEEQRQYKTLISSQKSSK